MKYLYFKLWQNLKRIKTNDMPATNAIFLISMVIFANIATIHVLLNQILTINLNLGSKNAIILFAISLCLSIMILNYFLLYKKRDQISERYKNESKTQSRIGNILLILYALGSFALVYFFGSRFPLR